MAETAVDRLVESEDFQSELICFYLIWAHADGAHEDEPHSDKVESLAQALGQLVSISLSAQVACEPLPF